MTGNNNGYQGHQFDVSLFQDFVLQKLFLQNPPILQKRKAFFSL